MQWQGQDGPRVTLVTRDSDVAPVRNNCMLFLGLQVALWTLGHRGGSATHRAALQH